jgi:ribosomal protein S6E (S10)
MTGLGGQTQAGRHSNDVRGNRMLQLFVAVMEYQRASDPEIRMRRDVRLREREEDLHPIGVCWYDVKRGTQRRQSARFNHVLSVQGTQQDGAIIAH